MKKTFILLLLLTMVIYTAGSIKAAYIETDYWSTESLVDEFDIWSLETKTNDVTVLNSNRYLFNGDRVNFELMPITYSDFTGNTVYADNIVVESRNNIHSVIAVYDDASDIVASSTYRILSEESSNPYAVLYSDSFESAVRNGDIENKYIRFELVLTTLDNGGSYERFLESFIGEDNYYTDYYSGYFYIQAEYYTDPFDMNDFDDITSLPVTTGNLANAGDFGSVRYKIVGQNIHFIVHYDDLDYHFLKAFDDVSMFEFSNQAYYYVDHDTGNHMIYFDYASANVPFLLNESLETVSYSPFLLFNLDTNETVYNGQAQVMAHVQTEHDDEAYVYFYLDGITYDDIEAIDITYQYYYEKDSGWLSNEKTSETHESYVSLVRGQSSVVSQTPAWVQSAYYGSIATMVLGGAVAIIPGAQAIGASIFLVGAVAYQASDVIDYTFYDLSIEDIAEYVPSSEMKATLEDYYSKSIGDESFTLPETARLYRLFLGEYDLGSYDRLQVISNSLEVMQITYSLNDQLIEIDSEWIVSHVSGDDIFEPIPYDPEVDTGFHIEIPDILKNPAFWIVITVVSISLVVLGAFASKGGEYDDRQYRKHHKRY